MKGRGIFALSIVVLLSGAALGAIPSDSKKKELSFDDLLVQGKYQMAREVVVTVEEDKALNSLLQVRKDFKDRIKVAAGLDDEASK